MADVFISYRRAGGSSLANLVRLWLQSKGLQVFLDVHGGMTGSRFDETLLTRIAEADVFVVILSPGCFNRPNKNEEDWLYKEIRHAEKCRKPIIPVLASGFNWKENAPPEQFDGLRRIDAVEYHEIYVEASIQRLYEAVVRLKKSVSPQEHSAAQSGSTQMTDPIQAILEEDARRQQEAQRKAEALRLSHIQSLKKQAAESYRTADYAKALGYLDDLLKLSPEDSSARTLREKCAGLLGIGSKAGQRMVKTVKGVEFAFRWCPAGTFMMGSPEDELGRYKNETQHSVTLSEGFWMLETEVTQKMWESVMGNNPSYFKGENRPVEQVSWDDCQEFCKKMCSLGMNVQLPTEAQWEYACRAGTTEALNNGKNLTSETGTCPNLGEVGWYGKNSGSTTHAVGQKKPNNWGLYDMHGNVWEWCSDWYGTYPSSGVTDPTGPESGSDRVLRGGCWVNRARYCRSADRSIYSPGYRLNVLGFRVSLVPVR